MPTAPKAKDPVVLSYLALRKAVGIMAFALPFLVSIPVRLHDGCFQPSISGYYYTETRNILVGCLCAIAMFLVACRGYDHIDRFTGTLSAVCALGVAFFPTKPEFCTEALNHPVCFPAHHTEVIHFVFATALFLALAYFCLRLFTKTTPGGTMTARKKHRNIVYVLCGIAILASMLLIALFDLVFKVDHLIGPLAPTFCFETTALFAFGVAWMVKGELVLGDPEPERTKSITTDRLPTPI